MRYLALLFALFLGLPAFAQGGGGGGDRAARMWKRLSRNDANGDGKVTREEFQGPARMFDRLDGDGDGTVTEDEVKKTAAGMRGRGRGAERGGRGQSSGRMLKRFDANSDGKVDKDEWGAFFETADKNGDGVLDGDEMTAALSGRSLRDPAPKKGADAPAVKAKDAKTGKMVNLRRITRPTVLVFGSWT